MFITGANGFIGRFGGYSIEKAQTMLGDNPTVTHEDGMKRSEAWLREAGFL